MRSVFTILALVLMTLGGPTVSPSAGQSSDPSFVNFESPHVHPLDLSPNGNTLAVVNTAANRVELFNTASGLPVHRGSVSVGLDPVSVRFRSNLQIWVVNHISDSISIVHTGQMRVLATVRTLDEPTDVVFAGAPRRAYVACSQVNTIQVWNPSNLSQAPVEIPIAAEEPRALAVSPDRKTVYAAIFESGNGTTVLGGGIDPADIENLTLTPNMVSHPAGPYGGQNPPPNRGAGFSPAMASNLPAPPPVSLIVKRDPQGRWLDDNGGDWTRFVSGSKAFRSGRIEGWKLLDRDVAVIDTASHAVRYIDGLMNLNMALAVNPRSGQVAVVGTDATNHIRYEPNLNGVFLRVNIALADLASKQIRDLNPHLNYRRARIPQAQRNLSLGDPRGLVWRGDGRRGYVIGMGSGNLVMVDNQGRRVGAPIAIGEGPTGLALDSNLNRLYVLSRFDARISVVDLRTERVIGRIRFFDPTPRVINQGRRFLYDTHRTSGLGHLSCGSCHVDARLDRLAWDLGDPSGDMKSQDGQNTTLIEDDTFQPWHPMKGPMTTQTLQDIIGKEPHHWRGDRDGIEEFNDAFVGLLGDDRRLRPAEMKQFKRFLASISFPPNPFRNFDNTLPADLPLPGHYRTGRFGNAGDVMPNGNAQQGLALFRDQNRALDDLSCLECHTLPVGSGTPMARGDSGFVPIAAGPNGEAHLALIGDDASVQLGIKVPHLRNLYDKVGFDLQRPLSRSGFGYLHDGSVDSLARFIANDIFDVRNDQEVANLLAFMLAFSGSDFGDPLSGEPPGTPSQDVPAAVGRQVTIGGAGQQSATIDTMIALADRGQVDLVAKAKLDGRERGAVYRSGSGTFQIDQEGAPNLSKDEALALATPASRLTFTVVPSGSGDRLGIDRDEDGVLDFDDPDQ